jgi:hypothetical protein
LTILGDERDIFIKGRRCENQGLGIGAFAYYRRIVEIKKNQLFDEIIRVAEAVRLEPRIIQELREAREETQFGKAMKTVHAGSDQECLEIATSIRVVLAELAEKIGNALKDERELNEVLGKLTRAGNGRQPAS